MFRSATLSIVATALLTVSASALTLTAIDDANTLRSAPTVNQGGGGTSVGLKQATTAQANSRTGFFKFNLAGVLPTAGDTATFTFSLGSSATADFGLRVFALKADVAGYDWSEDTITWNSSPGLDSSTDANFFLDPADVTLLRSLDVISGSPAGTKFSTTLADWDSFRQADATLTLILLAATQSNASPSLAVASSENGTVANRPTLTIVPEPGSTLLLATGLMAFARRRRTRA